MSGTATVFFGCRPPAPRGRRAGLARPGGSTLRQPRPSCERAPALALEVTHPLGPSWQLGGVQVTPASSRNTSPAGRVASRMFSTTSAADAVVIGYAGTGSPQLIHDGHAGKSRKHAKRRHFDFHGKPPHHVPKKGPEVAESAVQLGSQQAVALIEFGDTRRYVLSVALEAAVDAQGAEWLQQPRGPVEQTLGAPTAQCAGDRSSPLHPG